MLKRVVLLFGFLSTFTLSSAQHTTATADVKGETTSHVAANAEAHATEVKTNETEQQKTQRENKEIIDHHILDAHSFDIMQTKDGEHIGFSLPVIFYDKANGFHFMMSSAFHHGENVVESKGGYYKLLHEKIYKTDAAGTITYKEKSHFPTNEKVIDLSITKSVLMIIVTALLMIWIFGSMARSYKKSLVPSGVGKFFEPIILFVRDEIAKPNIGPKYGKYMNYLLTVFFFILFLNVFGLMPFGINVTGNIAITSALALVTFIFVQFTANKNYWMHIFWMPGVPVLMKIVMAVIELIGVIIKPFSLLIRLFANMTAGHIVIMTLISLIYVFKNWIAGSLFPLLTLVLYLIEILVAFLQAYIFTMLSAVYFGMANEEHHDHEAAH